MYTENYQLSIGNYCQRTKRNENFAKDHGNRAYDSVANDVKYCISGINRHEQDSSKIDRCR